jgi:hypothetical protein
VIAWIAVAWQRIRTAGALPSTITVSPTTEKLRLIR